MIENDQYVIGRMMHIGNNGIICKAVSVADPDQKLAIKIFEPSVRATNEIKAYSKFIRENNGFTPTSGCMLAEENFMSYMIIPRRGKTLLQYIHHYGLPSKLESLKICL